MKKLLWIKSDLYLSDWYPLTVSGHTLQHSNETFINDIPDKLITELFPVCFHTDDHKNLCLHQI